MSLINIVTRIVRNPLIRNPSFYKKYEPPSHSNVKTNIKRIFSESVPAKPIYDVNTKVANDVILFKYENTKFFKIMNYFACGQYLMWGYLGTFAFSTLRDAPVDKSTITKDTPWFRKVNLGDNKYRNTLGGVAVLFGTGSLALIWMYTLKSVKFLVLHKGGKHISFITYAPFGNTRVMKVPLDCVSANNTRTLAKNYLPIKVKNTWFHYILDMRGEFKNPALFDNTAGLYRKLK